jgi:hypothetical protein
MPFLGNRNKNEEVIWSIYNGTRLAVSGYVLSPVVVFFGVAVLTFYYHRVCLIIILSRNETCL